MSINVHVREPFVVFTSVLFSLLLFNFTIRRELNNGKFICNFNAIIAHDERLP